MAKITRDQAVTALVEVVREALVHGEDVHIPALGTFRVEYRPSQTEELPDGHLVMKPPCREILFVPHEDPPEGSSNGQTSMPESVVARIANRLDIQPEQTDRVLRTLAQLIKKQGARDGRVRVPGLGVFQHADDLLTFEPDEPLAEAVNHRYAGLEPVPLEWEPEAAEEHEAAAPAMLLPDALEEMPTEAVAEALAAETLEAETAEIEAAEIEAAETLEAEAAQVFEEEEADTFDTEAVEALDEEEADFFDEELTDAFDEEEPVAAEAEEAVSAAFEEAPVAEAPAEDLFEETPVAEAPAEAFEGEEEPAPEATAEALDEAAEVFDEETEVFDEETEVFDEAAEALDEAAAEALDEEEIEAPAFGLPIEEPDAEAAEAEAYAAPDEPAARPDEEEWVAWAPPGTLRPEEEPEPILDEDDVAAEAAFAAAPVAEPAAEAPALGDHADDLPPKPPPAHLPPREAARRRPVWPWLLLVFAVVVVGAAVVYYLNSRQPAPPVAEAPPTVETPGPEAAQATPAAPAGDPDAATDTPTDTAPEDATPAAPPAETSPASEGPIDRAVGGYTLVVASVAEPADAQAEVARYRRRLADASVPVDVLQGTKDGQTWYRIAVGQEPTVDDALALKNRLGETLPAGAWVTRITPDS